MKCTREIKRGCIPEGYVSATQEYVGSMLYVGRKTVSSCLASFSAINSLLSDEVVTKTSIGFTPILPHPIIDFESV